MQAFLFISVAHVVDFVKLVWDKRAEILSSLVGFDFAKLPYVDCVVGGFV